MEIWDAVSRRDPDGPKKKKLSSPSAAMRAGGNAMGQAMSQKKKNDESSDRECDEECESGVRIITCPR